MKKYRLVKTRVYETNKIQIVEFMWNTAHGWRGRVLEKDSPNETARQRQFWSNRPYVFVKEELPKVEKVEECKHEKTMTVYRKEEGGYREMCLMKCGKIVA